MGSILVVDDERSMREFLAICLRRGGHQVTVGNVNDRKTPEKQVRDGERVGDVGKDVQSGAIYYFPGLWETTRSAGNVWCVPQMFAEKAADLRR